MKKITLLAILLMVCTMVTALATSGRGDRGKEVEELQALLVAQGYLLDTADGVFGNNTEYAVLVFQKEHGLTPDGRVKNNSRGSKHLEIPVLSRYHGLVIAVDK